MFNWKALSKSELKKEIKAFGRKDLKRLKIMLEEIEAEEHFAWGMYMKAEGEEENEKWEKNWQRIDDKWWVVRDKINKLEKGKDSELVRADRG